MLGWEPGRHPLPSAAEFARRLGERGVGSRRFRGRLRRRGRAIAARLWWMLDNLGHRGGVAVLDGGIAAWTAAGHPLSQDVPSFETERLDVADDWHNVVERHELIDRLGQVTLIDGRAAERYRGEVEPIDPVAGHIPTARNMPVTDNLDATGRLRQPLASCATATSPSWTTTNRSSSRAAVADRLPQCPGDANCGAARPDPLCGLIQRLEPLGNAGRDRS